MQVGGAVWRGCGSHVVEEESYGGKRGYTDACAHAQTVAAVKIWRCSSVFTSFSDEQRKRMPCISPSQTNFHSPQCDRDRTRDPISLFSRCTAEEKTVNAMMQFRRGNEAVSLRAAVCVSVSSKLARPLEDKPVTRHSPAVRYRPAKATACVLFCLRASTERSYCSSRVLRHKCLSPALSRAPISAQQRRACIERWHRAQDALRRQ